MAGFTLVEILITAALLSFIIIGLLMMFSQTQHAFVSSMTQTDMLEAGRCVNDLIVNDMSDVTPAELPNTLNFYADFDYGMQPLILSLPGSTEARTNIIQKFYFLSENNLVWSAVAYQVVPYYTDSTGEGYGPGALYRFVTNITRYAAAPLGLRLTSQTNLAPNTPPLYYDYNFSGVFVSSNKIADGVVDLRVRAFATNGWPITYDMTYRTNAAVFRVMTNAPYVTNFAFVNFAQATLPGGNAPNVGEPLYYAFWSNALPAQIELEYGLLEPRILQHFQGLAQAGETAQLQYLSNHAAEVHIFRQRISVGSVDPYAYQ
jgi:hypothetical protein